MAAKGSGRTSRKKKKNLVKKQPDLNSYTLRRNNRLATAAKEKQNTLKKGHMTGEQMGILAWRFLASSLWIFLLAAVILFTVSGTGYAYKTGYAMFNRTPKAVEEQEISITIPEGATVKTVAGQLKEAGLLSDTLVFKIDAFFFSYKVKPGTYVLNTTWRERQIIETLNTKQKDT